MIGQGEKNYLASDNLFRNSFSQADKDSKYQNPSRNISLDSISNFSTIIMPHPD